MRSIAAKLVIGVAITAIGMFGADIRAEAIQAKLPVSVKKAVVKRSGKAAGKTARKTAIKGPQKPARAAKLPMAASQGAPE